MPSSRSVFEERKSVQTSDLHSEQMRFGSRVGHATLGSHSVTLASHAGLPCQHAQVIWQTSIDTTAPTILTAASRQETDFSWFHRVRTSDSISPRRLNLIIRYPNVGKSSVINTLRAQKVSVDDEHAVSTRVYRLGLQCRAHRR